MRDLKLFPLFLAFMTTASTARCLDLQTVSAASGAKFTVCRVNLKTDVLELFLRNDAGKPLKTFDAVNHLLQARNQKLAFGMNAGMYHEDFSPVGLFVSGGRELAPLNLEQHKGNFFLKPNGVFFINETGAHIAESSRYPTVAGHVRLATQSGPMLVIDGKIHPAFNADSKSRLIRNGVGIVSPGEIVFVLAYESVNFYTFAQFFRDTLHCQNALYLDGDISSLYTPAMDWNNRWMDFGPIIGVVVSR